MVLTMVNFFKKLNVIKGFKKGFAFSSPFTCTRSKGLVFIIRDFFKFYKKENALPIYLLSIIKFEIGNKEKSLELTLEL